MSDAKLQFMTLALRRTMEDLVVAPLAERLARTPGWRDATVRIAVSGDPGDADIVV